MKDGFTHVVMIFCKELVTFYSVELFLWRPGTSKKIVKAAHTQKKSSKKSKSVSERKVNIKKNKKRSGVKSNKTKKQKGGSQVGENYDEGCNQLTKKTCGKNNCVTSRIGCKKAFSSNNKQKYVFFMNSY